MIASYATLVGTLATLQAVSAQQFKSNDVLQRLENRLEIGDECHSPQDTYVLSKAGQPTIPPCIAEQGISSACEALTQALIPQSDPKKAAANYKAYQQCLTGPGSSYREEIMGCLACKVQHNKLSKAQHDYYVKKWTAGLNAFAADAQPQTYVWNYVQGGIDWVEYKKLPTPNPSDKVSVKPVAEYYPQAPKVQGLGTFTHENRTYPEAALREQGLLPQEPVQRLDPVGMLIDAQVKAAPAAVNAQSESVVQPTTLVRLASGSKLSASTGTVARSSELSAVSSTAAPAGTSSKSAVVSGSVLPVVPGSVLPVVSSSRLSVFSNHTSAVAPLSDSAATTSHTGATGPTPVAASQTQSAVAVADINVAAATSASSNAEVLVQSCYRDTTILVKFGPGLHFSVVDVAGTIHAVAGAELRRIPASQAARRGLPDLSGCETCKQTVSLGSAARSSAVTNHPAGRVGQQVCAVFGDKSLPEQVRREKAQDIVHVAGEITVSAAAHVSANVGVAATFKDTPARPGRKQAAVDEIKTQGSASQKQAVAGEVLAQTEARVEAKLEAKVPANQKEAVVGQAQTQVEAQVEAKGPASQKQAAADESKAKVSVSQKEAVVGQIQTQAQAKAQLEAKLQAPAPAQVSADNAAADSC
ncbi:hypothetical protein HRG_000722 [Hirsutella rhossiliensis]|uniref:Uncharacterized protein n=1 Tax=Hirsutella rhossiliensis TaxID=111463 RepID=A0A9P8N764_9HYPO|nr:uncharacterized protein HRG_00722 [Hirsutella rhossiliensis]KAH0968080.1 hypothetical protein HRG_00722 [Hirsutella rhossiliensis]